MCIGEFQCRDNLLNWWNLLLTKKNQTILEFNFLSCKKKIVIGLSWPLFNGCNINHQTLSKRQRWSNFKLISWHCVRNRQVVDNYLHWKMWQVNVTFHCNKNFNWPLKFIKIFSWLIYFLIIFSHGLTLCVQNTFGCVDEIRGNVSTVKLHSLNQL